ncbi:uncharacterized protein GJ701_004653 [Geothlypis trichas]
MVRPRGIPAPRFPANTGTGVRPTTELGYARRVCISPVRLCKLTRGTWLFLPPPENCISKEVSKGGSTPWQGRVSSRQCPTERPTGSVPPSYQRGVAHRVTSTRAASVSDRRGGPVVAGAHAGPGAATWLPSLWAGPMPGHAPAPEPVPSADTSGLPGPGRTRQPISVSAFVSVSERGGGGGSGQRRYGAAGPRPP